MIPVMDQEGRCGDIDEDGAEVVLMEIMTPMMPSVKKMMTMIFPSVISPT